MLRVATLILLSVTLLVLSGMPAQAFLADPPTFAALMKKTVHQELGGGNPNFEVYPSFTALGDNSKQLFQALNQIPKAVGPNGVVGENTGNYLDLYRLLLDCHATSNADGLRSRLGDEAEKFDECWSDIGDPSSPMDERAKCNKCARKVSPSYARVVRDWCTTTVLGSAQTRAADKLQLESNFFDKKDKQIPLYTQDIQFVKSQIAGERPYSFTLTSSEASSYYSATRAEAHYGSWFWGGGVSASRVEQAMSKANLQLRVTIGSYATIKFEQPLVFDSGIVTSMFQTPNDFNVWDKTRAECRWPKFFDLTTGSFRRRISQLLIVDNIQITMTSGKNDFEGLETDFAAAASAGMWPFGGGGASASSNTASSYFKNNALSFTYGSSRGDPYIFARVTEDFLSTQAPTTQSVRPGYGSYGNSAYGRDNSYYNPTDDYYYNPIGYQVNWQDLKESYLNVRNALGPIAVHSLDRPECGVKLFTCISAFGDYSSELTDALKYRDARNVLEFLDRQQLCACVPCLPPNQQSGAANILRCSPDETSAQLGTTELLDECQAKVFQQSLRGEAADLTSTPCGNLLVQSHKQVLDRKAGFAPKSKITARPAHPEELKRSRISSSYEIEEDFDYGYDRNRRYGYVDSSSRQPRRGGASNAYRRV